MLNQDYSNYSVVYIDDCSPDSTGKRVARWCKAHHCGKRWTVIRNTERRGSLANIVWAVHNSAAQHEIIIVLDGDDYFSHSQVLSKINKLYQQNVWVLYGQFQNIPSGKRGFSKIYPPEVITTNTFRKFGFFAGAPRTFYAWIMHKIAHKDMQEQNDSGLFFQCAGDVAFMFPLLEMAGSHHAFYDDDILYLRTTNTGINDFLIHKSEQERITRYIRSQDPYQPLEIWQYGAHTLCTPTTLRKVFIRSPQTLDTPWCDRFYFQNNSLNNLFYENIQEAPPNTQNQKSNRPTNDTALKTPTYNNFK